MIRDELLREIEEAFCEAGKLGGWEYKNFLTLLQHRQLSHFQIFEIGWFPGAAKIMDLVDQLHSVETPKQDFLDMADLMGIEIDENLSKIEIAKIIKSRKDWKVCSYNLEINKRLDLRKEKLAPLYKEFEKYGYKTDMLPKQVTPDKWIVDATNSNGEIETLYLNESPDKNYVLVQSYKHDVICVLNLEESGLIERMNCNCNN